MRCQGAPLADGPIISLAIIGITHHGDHGERYAEVEREIMNVAAPYYWLWQEMEQYTSGDGYLDKLCMELVGLDSSRCRPPTRDVRERFRHKARQMLLDCGTPKVVE